MKKVVSGILDAGLILLSGAWITGRFLGGMSWACALFVHFQHYYFATASLILILNLLLRRWRAAGVNALLAGAIAWPIAQIHLPARTDTPSRAKSPIRKLLLHNVLVGNGEHHSVERFLRTENADIVVLLETSKTWFAQLSGISQHYPHESKFPHASGVGSMWILSYHPIDSSTLWSGNVLEFPALADLRISLPEGRVRLLAAHPVPPLSPRSSELHRQTHAEILRRSTGESRLILAGDFNTTPWAPEFLQLKRKGNFSFSAAGRPLRLTWRPFGAGFNNVPFVGLPLDHCLVSTDIRVINHRLGPFSGSDHRAVVLEFQLRAFNE